jgi:alkylation response protein AidB-like acyl-CoA dehydrogenase
LNANILRTPTGGRIVTDTAGFSVPQHVRPLRDEVLHFVEDLVYPAEPVLHGAGEDAASLMRELQAEAKKRSLWALGHPKELGGGGLPFLDYVFVNEVQGRSEFGQVALGTYSLQDSIMLNKYASPEWRDRYLKRLVEGEIFPSFAMTEPDVASSDPTQLKTAAVLDGNEWVITGRKWFTTYANRAAYTTVMCRTEPDAPPHKAFSMIVVPTDSPGYNIVRETPVLGISGGHCEVVYDDVRVPRDNLLGPRGHGFVIAQERLGPGRIFHCMRWLGQAQRAFDLMCDRLNNREAFGAPLAEKQLMQKHVFDSWAEIQSCRLLTLHAAEKIDRGERARVEISVIKVVGARMLHNVIDRAIQVFGAKGLTDDTPLSFMYRAARAGRIYDGPDEVHMQSSARRILKEYEEGDGWDFGLR